jgi:hypothetical protein
VVKKPPVNESHFHQAILTYPFIEIPGRAAYFGNRVPKPEKTGDHLIVENK